MSAIMAIGSADTAEREYGLDLIVQAYWKPVYKYIRIKWRKSNEDAKDLTQGFFAQAIERDFFRGFDPNIAKFRTFLRTCLDGFVANEEKAAKRIKRGGDRQTLSLDFQSAENELKLSIPDDGQSLDDYFDQEWIRSLFAITVALLKEALSADEKAKHFEIFECYDLHDASASPKPTYDELAQRFNLPVTQVTNFLAYTRREFRRILLEKLRQVTVSDAEFRGEARTVLGIDVK
jgi:RNA polymerase sigma factor (sigma-70 family)